MKTQAKRLGLFLLIVVFLSIRMSLSAAVPQVQAGPMCNASFLVDGTGAMNSWGENGFGALGIGGYNDQPTPVAVSFPSGVHAWLALAGANGFAGDWTYAIGDDFQLYGAGYGLGISSQHFTLVTPPSGIGGWAAIAASDTGWLAVSTNGPICGNINGTVLWQPKPGATRWTQVAVCSYTSSTQPDLFALDNRGKLFAYYSGTAWFASPASVEIPVPSGATAWTHITAGAYHVLALADDGNLYAWGNNASGQLGQGTIYVYTNAPQRVSLPTGKTGWKNIAAGWGHSLATTTDGQVFAWGYNSYGQLGLGDSQYKTSPTPVPGLTNATAIAAGKYHSLAVMDCQVMAWGANSSGQLGAGFTSSYYPQPINSQFAFDICSTNPPTLPLVSLTVSDPVAAEGTWLSAFGITNTGRFEISRSVTSPSDLPVQLSVSGTASNGVDYRSIPSTITIPANSNSISLFVIPTGAALSLDPSTVTVRLVPDPAYQLGNPTNGTVTLIQYEADADTTPIPALGFKFQLFVGTNFNGQPFVIESSTNLMDWVVLGTGTNNWGVVSIIETNRTLYRQRYFRVYPQ